MANDQNPTATLRFTRAVDIDDMFGKNCFNRRAQKEYLSEKTFLVVDELISKRQPLSAELTEEFASGMHQWATDHRVTHFTHWFTPMTGRSASKHDSFFVRKGEQVLSKFKGKTLAIGEPDASSFPNGGLRGTHEARGYTVWDPSVPAFIIEHENGATLCIPTIFFSWKGDALDEKIPLLRSGKALQEQAVAALQAAGLEGHHQIHADSGIEQEFFLIDKHFYHLRPDLVQTGRTLVGRAPPKGQELSDNYFTDLSARAVSLINTAEKELWKLGIPQTTRHKEVAPGQYEIAPVFSEAGLAADRNLMTMEVLGRVAKECDMEVLLHEKPFAGLNGSGKHNNWSIGTNKMGTVFEPTSSPQTNEVFMLFLTAVIRAVDVHQDLMRAVIATVENDHRLGGHEAPPAIVSIYLGATVSAAIDRYLADDDTPFDSKMSRDVGISGLPEFKIDLSDRNRTSPFAFTGNKFEFRAVGSSQAVHRSSSLLNTITADSCRFLAEQINSKVGAAATAADRKAATRDVLKETLKTHMRIVFDGDAYSAEWHAEAERRGLLNLGNTTETLDCMVSDKAKRLYSSLNVLSEAELVARANVAAETYSTKLTTEARSLVSIVNRMIVPAVAEQLTKLPKNHSHQKARYNRVSQLLDHLIRDTDKLETTVEKAEEGASARDTAVDLCGKVVPLLEEVRVSVDELENLCAEKAWPLPSYHSMLFTGQHHGLAVEQV